jgi:hypothetical protein
LSSGIIETSKELENKFFERFFIHNHFQIRRSDILIFKEHDQESLYEAYERFKILKRKCSYVKKKRKCSNHNVLHGMEQILIFTGGMMMQHKMILDTSTGCSIENKMHEEVKELIEQMFQNQYNTSNEREPKQDELLEVDKETAYKVEIELLKRKLPRKSLQIQR